MNDKRQEINQQGMELIHKMELLKAIRDMETDKSFNKIIDKTLAKYEKQLGKVCEYLAAH
jgi:hypothetical protein